MPPLGKIQKKDWSIEEWLEESMDRRRKILRKKGLLWNRTLKEGTEIVLSSSDESTKTEINSHVPSGTDHGEPKEPTITRRLGGRISERELTAINRIKVKSRGGIRACKFWNSSIGCANESQCKFAHNLCILCGRGHIWYFYHGTDREQQEAAWKVDQEDETID